MRNTTPRGQRFLPQMWDGNYETVIVFISKRSTKTGDVLCIKPCAKGFPSNAVLKERNTTKRCGFASMQAAANGGVFRNSAL